MTWNFDMSEAPRGHTETRTHTIKGVEVTRDVHIPDIIIAAGSGGVVTTSKWMPDQKRWNFFTEKVPPIAWQPWPSHPEAKP